MAIKLLLQTTIPRTADDWSIDRFSLLAGLLREERDESGRARFDVTMRDRDPLGAPDLLRQTADDLVYAPFKLVHVHPYPVIHHHGSAAGDELSERLQLRLQVYVRAGQRVDWLVHGR